MILPDPCRPILATVERSETITVPEAAEAPRTMKIRELEGNSRTYDRQSAEEQPVFKAAYSNLCSGEQYTEIV